MLNEAALTQFDKQSTLLATFEDNVYLSLPAPIQSGRGNLNGKEGMRFLAALRMTDGYCLIDS